ncbi:D-cysteine desulfhydrase family protein [Microbulbifer sp. A4B17]|uniref:D-cysteine desulfhydrase family protein n=1 Tax=Microbulbifer sp. A4B17 TaxID=359370 RepID=UPI000D52C7ED|nr:D-cysteine desulfhydrase family protein [Microbulbifer sp. A4B17]AWF81722.1 D-cysteine desulfhydrase family protein [Microbulbifer sp. A4B17]
MLNSLPIDLPERLCLANLPTPLQSLDRISDLYSLPYGGPRIWMKRDDLTESGMSGNKLRKLEFVAAEARSKGAQVLITCGGIQSNHCRTTALVGARLGFRVQLILRGESPSIPDGNLLLGQLAGAETAFYSPKEYSRDLPTLFANWATENLSRGQKSFCIPTGASDGLGIWGYIAASQELLADCSDRGFVPDHILCATGSGGTQAGLTLGCHLLQANAKVTGFAVCDSASYFQAKVREDILQWAARSGIPIDLKSLEVLVNADYRGPAYGVAEPGVYQTIRELAHMEGVLLDPVYTGKAFHGLLQELKKGKYRGSDNLIFIHTGGQFGLFPYRDHFPLAAE